jgi:fructose-bisphosphate aldolase class II/tagatose 1,6-diphosphate aldolase GatY/KbaY
VGVHLDHCRDPAEIDACLALGYSSVMIDGSHLPFEENVALTRAVVERARAAGAWVEAELGALSGDEDRSGAATAEGMTDPSEAAEFARRTGVDALAVAVGNVHGFTPEPVRLDLDRLRAIAAVCDAPLVLHGASGLPGEDLRGAVAAGVVKVNVNAELRRAHIEALRADVGDDVRALQTLAIEAMTRVAEEKIALLAS